MIDLNALVREIGKQQTNDNWHVWRLYFRKVGDGVEVAGGNIEHNVTPEIIGHVSIGDDIGKAI